MRRMLVVAVLVTMAGCTYSKSYVRVDDSIAAVSAAGADSVWVVDRRITTTTTVTAGMNNSTHVDRRQVDRLKRCELSQGLLVCFEPKRR